MTAPPSSSTRNDQRSMNGCRGPKSTPRRKARTPTAQSTTGTSTNRRRGPSVVFIRSRSTARARSQLWFNRRLVGDVSTQKTHDRSCGGVEVIPEDTVAAGDEDVRDVADTGHAIRDPGALTGHDERRAG